MVLAICILKFSSPLKVVDARVGNGNPRVAGNRDAVGVISRVKRHGVRGIDGRRRLVCRALKGAVWRVYVPAALDAKQGAKHRGHLPKVNIQRAIGLIEITALV